MRGTSRREEGLAAIEAAGIEPALADPDRPGTVLELVGDVAVVVWLLGSAAGRAGGRSTRSTAPRLERAAGKAGRHPGAGLRLRGARAASTPVLLRAGREARPRRRRAPGGSRSRVVEADPADPLAALACRAMGLTVAP